MSLFLPTRREELLALGASGRNRLGDNTTGFRRGGGWFTTSLDVLTISRQRRVFYTTSLANLSDRWGWFGGFRLGFGGFRLGFRGWVRGQPFFMRRARWPGGVANLDWMWGGWGFFRGGTSRRQGYKPAFFKVTQQSALGWAGEVAPSTGRRGWEELGAGGAIWEMSKHLGP